MIFDFRYRFEAAHRFLSSDSPPCMTPHGHSWYIRLQLKFLGSQLNASQMGVEFSKVKDPWRQFVQKVLDHSFLHNINDPLVEILKNQSPPCRLLPFPGDPTTELISVLVFHKMNQVLSEKNLKEPIQVIGVELEETPTNRVICDSEFYQKQIQSLSDYKAWWTTSDLFDRSFHGQ